MALPVVIAKNQTVSDILLASIGIDVPGSGQVTLTGVVDAPATFFECATDDTLITAIASGDIVVNDGISDLSTAEGLAYLDASGGEIVTGVAERIKLLQTTSRNWSLALRLTTVPLEAGTYRVGWSAIGRNSSTQGDWRVRVQVDDTIDVIAPNNGGYAGWEAKDSGSDQRNPASGFRHVSLGSGVHNIDLDLAQNGNGTAYLYHAVLEIWKAS